MSTDLHRAVWKAAARADLPHRQPRAASASADAAADRRPADVVCAALEAIAEHLRSSTEPIIGSPDYIEGVLDERSATANGLRGLASEIRQDVYGVEGAGRG